MTTKQQLENGRAVERLDRKIEKMKIKATLQWFGLGLFVALSVFAGSLIYIMQSL